MIQHWPPDITDLGRASPQATDSSLARYGSGVIGSGLVGFFANGTPWPMGGVVALVGIGSLVSVLLSSRR